ncbi:hypothetical protein Fcan01_08774, partial [Folsomia candida]
MMSNAAQSVPGPSHVAGSTTHPVIAATITTTSTITPEISDESARIGRYLRTLDNALDDIIYVLDDKRRRGYPIYEMSKAKRNQLEKAAASIMSGIVLDFVPVEEMSAIPPATPRPSPPSLPVTPPATTMSGIMLDFVPVEEMRTIPAATLRPSTPPPLPVNPPEIAEAEIIVDLQVKEMSTILEPPATPRPPITLLPVTSHGTAVPEIIVDEETWTIPEPPATPTSSTPPSPLPVTPP